MMNELKVGDIIKCHDSEDAIKVMVALAKEGIDTDFDYEQGIRLVITKVDRKE